MQISEMFRRGILVAKNNQSEIELSRWFIEKSIYVEYLPIIDDALFVKLYKTELFSSINKISNSHIDDYEEEKVSFNYVPEIKKVVTKLLKGELDTEVKRYLSDFIELLDYAYDYKREIFFIF